MFRKILVIIVLLALLSVSFVLLNKTPENNKITASENEELPVKEEVLPETNYTFNIQNMSSECSETNSALCAVEMAVKCTIKPDMKECQKLKLPKFIFMTDQSIDRPTEISYKFISKKPLPNNTMEIYTESSCNGSWFGLCQGTVIYVLAPEEKTTDHWFVRDIYAIE